MRTGTEVVDALGDGRLEHLTLRNRVDGSTGQVTADALFVLIGGLPHTDWLPPEVEVDPAGFVVTGDDLADRSRFGPDPRPQQLETSIPGIYAAGDVRRGSVKRVAAAVGEGATVITHVHQRLSAGNGTGDAPAPAPA